MKTSAMVAVVALPGPAAAVEPMAGVVALERWCLVWRCLPHRTLALHHNSNGSGGVARHWGVPFLADPQQVIRRQWPQEVSAGQPPQLL